MRSLSSNTGKEQLDRVVFMKPEGIASLQVHIKKIAEMMSNRVKILKRISMKEMSNFLFEVGMLQKTRGRVFSSSVPAANPSLSISSGHCLLPIRYVSWSQRSMNGGSLNYAFSMIFLRPEPVT